METDNREACKECGKCQHARDCVTCPMLRESQGVNNKTTSIRSTALVSKRTAEKTALKLVADIGAESIELERLV